MYGRQSGFSSAAVSVRGSGGYRKGARRPPYAAKRQRNAEGRFGGERSDTIRSGDPCADAAGKAEGLATLRTQTSEKNRFRNRYGSQSGFSSAADSVRGSRGYNVRGIAIPLTQAKRSNVNCARGTEGPQTPLRKRSRRLSGNKLLSSRWYFPCERS